MKNRWKYYTTHIILSILFVIAALLSATQSSQLVYAQVPSPTPNGPGSITTSISAANTATPGPASTASTAPNSPAGTPVPHTGGGTITTRITGSSPSSVAALPTTQPKITTSKGPAVKPNGPSAASAVGPTFQVSAACSADANGVMTITNTGTDMTTPFTYRLSLNGIPVAQNSFQLTSGQTFNLSTTGLYGTLTLDVLDTTNTVVATGSTFCLSPTATPTQVPPAFQVSASCSADANGILIITNTGGNMPTAFTWRLSLNGIPVAQNSFQISPGQSFNISTTGLYGTLTMDVLDATNTVVATGSAFCLSPTATLTPTTTPTPVPPAFQVSASCSADANGIMIITNTGGNMPTAFTWRLSLNGIPVAQNSFQISPGQSFNISTTGLYGTLTMDVLDATNTVIATGSAFCQSPTATPTVTPVESATPSPTVTDTSTFTPTPTLADTSTFTPTPTPTLANTSTPTPTATNTSIPTSTFTPSPTFTYTPSPTATRVPVPPRVVSSNPYNHDRLEHGPARITVFFSQDVIHDGSTNAANNLINYLLVENGRNNKFETTSCRTGRSGDDLAVSFTSVTYNRVLVNGHLTFSATLRLNPVLPFGSYRLFVCGSTSIKNLAGIKLNNGADTIISFSVSRQDGH